MEHCPLCGRDTACCTVTVRAGNDPKKATTIIDVYVEYRCIECWVAWLPNRSVQWRPMAKFNRNDLEQKGLLPAWS